MNAGKSTGHSFVSDFVKNNGIKLLEICLNLDYLYQQNCRDIVNIFWVLDSEAFKFYDELTSDQFKKLIEI